MTGRCPHCNAYAVRLPSPLWRVAHVLGWGYAAASVLGASLIGPMIIGVIPVLLFGGACLVSETHRRGWATPTCDACGRYAHAPAVAREVGRAFGRREPLVDHA